MSDAQYKSKRQIREARQVIVAELYKKGASVRKIAEEVKLRMNVETCSVSTIHSDTKALLKEWRKTRINDIDYAVQLELERIDDLCWELYEAWEKSKIDHTTTQTKRKGELLPSGKAVAPNGEIKDKQEIINTAIEKVERQEINCGDPRFIAEIRMQHIERRKLVGLYAPEKRDITERFEFANFLQQAGTVDD